jgi:hypothetical protein
MSAEKRSVHTDALATLGNKIGPREKRDAIHLAIELVVAGDTMVPGMHVGLGHDGLAYPTAIYSVEGLGIVDPFLTESVKKGEWFWLIVYPRQITSLRHVWEHPAFDSPPVINLHVQRIDARVQVVKDYLGPTPDDQAAKRAATREMEEIVAEIGIDFGDLIAAAEQYQIHGDITTQYDGESWRDWMGSNIERFWTAYERLTGKTVTERENFFSCNC